MVNPYDISQTAEALHVALTMPAGERRARAERLRAAASAHPPAAWFASQLSALGFDVKTYSVFGDTVTEMSPGPGQVRKGSEVRLLAGF